MSSLLLLSASAASAYQMPAARVACMPRVATSRTSACVMGMTRRHVAFGAALASLTAAPSQAKAVKDCELWGLDCGRGA